MTERSQTAAHVSPFAGDWYPGDTAALSELLDKLWDGATRRAGASPLSGGLAFVVPHAGLVYSGTVAAAAYRHLERQPPRRVVLLGFRHRGSPRGLWVPEISAYRTPLGDVEVDGEALAQLTPEDGFQRLAESRLCDHSIEIQLPLLQRAAPGSRIVPVYVSAPEPPARRKAARALGALESPGTVFLASSDFTHYGRAFRYQPFPADDRTPRRLRELDEEAMEAAGSLDADLFLATLRDHSATVCGYEPISLLLDLLRGRDGDDEIFQEELDYQTSGEITGEFEHSVSYAALGYFPYRSFCLSEEEQALLLESARRTLAEYQATGRRIPIPPERLTPGIERPGAAFVSLHKAGELRGCIGRHASGEPLARVVPEMTLAAALDDSRFSPVRRDESGIDVEISILSPFKRVAGKDSFIVNRHGAMLSAGGRQGLLLPQVATERGWGAGEFFDALARKSGVSRSVYDDPATRLYVFRAQIVH